MLMLLDILYNILYKIAMSNFISISDARQKLPELVSHIHEKNDRAFITVNGKPKAVLVSFEELESLEETAEVMAIPRIKKDIKESQEQFKKGEFTYLSDLK